MIRIGPCPATPGCVAFQVADNDVGVPEAAREAILDRFRRCHDPARSSGSGLGLAICTRVARRHDRRIEARDREGGGACFVVTLAA